MQYSNVKALGEALAAAADGAEGDFEKIFPTIREWWASGEMDYETFEAIVRAIVHQYGTVAEVAAVEYLAQLAAEADSGYEPTVSGTESETLASNTKWVAEALEAGDWAEAQRRLAALADMEVKGAGRRTMVDNALRMGGEVKFARVPTGEYTCGFCVMLASRGFVYASKESAGELSRYHTNCDCVVIADYEGAIEGYDYTPYAEQYYEAKEAVDRGDSPSVTAYINLQNYDNYRDRRNELRRIRYAETHLKKS